MKEKIEKKKRNSKIVKCAVIGCVAALGVVIMIRNIFGVHIELPDEMAISLGFLVTFGLFGSIITYFVNFFFFDKGMRLLHKLDISIDSCLWGEATAARLPESKIMCTDNAMIFEKQKLIIPYSSVEWIYKRETKAYGLVTTDVSLVIVTSTGAEFYVTCTWKMDNEIMWIIGNYAGRFSKDFVLGFGPEQLQKRKEIKKRKREEKRK